MKLSAPKNLLCHAVIVSSLAIVSGCEPKATDGQEAGIRAVAPPAKVVDRELALSGEFRLVKIDGNASVYVLKDGKLSAISNWGWVQKNASNKSIETISKAELESYPGSGITYR